MAMRTEAAVKGRTAHRPLSPGLPDQVRDRLFPARRVGSLVRAIGADSGRPS